MKFKLDTQEIQTLLEKKDYIHALSLSKKLISEFPHEKKALKILAKSQNSYDKDKIRREKETTKTDKIKTLLQEI